ncbi:hypothetical protein RHMOL_Rhmol06G0131400 [Rhododendron molle]|uniref:Uncharacterized protein n=1 Tax=Rhododendron molle TaxID=49168 RepID=A0ACC0NDT5_RHOML|nr:hypothetical protein RHMOL_Rhmol06G0131400 [Rhododendron molle]
MWLGRLGLQRWVTHYNQASVEHLDCIGSDHKALLLKITTEVRRRVTPFRFDARWCEYEEVQTIVKNQWEQGVTGSRLFCLNQKIRNCRLALKSWRVKQNLNSRKKIDQACMEIKVLESEGRELHPDRLTNLENQMANEWAKEELYWQQKSHHKWLQSGDRNTSYFHASTVERRRRNHISGIENAYGVWISDQHGIADEFQSFFQHLYVSEGVQNIQQVTNFIPHRVSTSMNNSLLKPFTSREIKAALFEMHPNRAPGYDGMTAGFFQRYWGIVGVDVCRAVRSFFHDGRMLRSVNRTQIVLIPKVQTPTKVSQFRPISLRTISYKIIAKVLANRLKPFLPSIVSENQSAFVGGRQIMDNVLIAHELTHYIKHKRSGSHGVAAFKLDMAKAYDRIEWSYLEMVMTQLGFHQKWIGWVMECVKTVSFSITVNGEAGDTFYPSRGIRQGCLSLHICSSCVEKDCEALSRILDSYEAASGQKINKDKSSVFFSPNTPIQARNLLSAKNNKALRSYKESKINHAGREVLLKSVLLTHPNYAMSYLQGKMNVLKINVDCPKVHIESDAEAIKSFTSCGFGFVKREYNRAAHCYSVVILIEVIFDLDVFRASKVAKKTMKIPRGGALVVGRVSKQGGFKIVNKGCKNDRSEREIEREREHLKFGEPNPSKTLKITMGGLEMGKFHCPPPKRETMDKPSARSSDGSREIQVTAPRYRVLPNETDLNSPPLLSSIPEKVLPIAAAKARTSGDLPWESLMLRREKKWQSDGIAQEEASDQVKEKSRCSMQESDKYKRLGNEGFLRVLFWQFHNFRMLLGSDLLLFSNEKYAAVSLHLWDVSRQVTSLTWLEAWLDNVMASVPELAICYHEGGVVQGYELLKTDDIFLLKGVSEDGTPAFYPHVVQQNGLSVLRFLQENCKQDPGAYWLYKSAGEDAIQLFDLSVIPKTHSSNDCDDSSTSLTSPLHNGRSDSLLSLGTLLYRIAHRLSLSMSPNNRARCARFFKKCLDLLDEPDHLVVRAIAHEQFARFLLTYDEELDLTPEALPVDSGVIVFDAEEESFDLFNSNSKSIVRDMVYAPLAEDETSTESETCQDSQPEASLKVIFEEDISGSDQLVASIELEFRDPGAKPSSDDGNSEVCDMSKSLDHVVQTIVDPISSKLAAIHHVSQAIKSLRWKRQLQSIESDDDIRTQDSLPRSIDFSVCACGDVDCIEVCDIREWLPTSKLDDKLWKLVLLLGESYLALGQAYKDNCQLHQALKVVELASLVYGSMPQYLEETRFISSMVCGLPQHMDISDRKGKIGPIVGGPKKVISGSTDDFPTSERFSSTYLFWAKAWTLVGDVYVEFHMVKGKEVNLEAEGKPLMRELRMSSEVLKEVKRLKKKLGPFNQNCTSCLLVNCSCQSDRASSGSSASSSRGDICPLSYGRKQNRRTNVKNGPYSLSGIPEDDHIPHKVVISGKSAESGFLKHSITSDMVKEASTIMADVRGNSKRVDETEAASSETIDVKNGGIFKYLVDPVIGDVEYNLSVALSCYEEARKALGGDPRGSVEIQSILKKKGWVCNEMGRKRLERKELDNAELAFSDAINSFREVSDHTNIILIYCNMGHGRRALAEETVSKMEALRKHGIFCDACNQALETTKMEYRESLRYYGAAKMELNAILEEADPVSSSLKDEVCTQFAHTYLRLGMLLAREDTTAEVYENGALETFLGSGFRRANKKFRKHEVSANDAITEALSGYESLGELRKQEAAYAYFLLACYQRDCCLKFLESDQKKSNLSRGENSLLQRVKQYASLAERNWQKSMDFYKPETHAVMYLTILLERSALSISLSGYFHSLARSDLFLPLLFLCILNAMEIPEFQTYSWSCSHAKHTDTSLCNGYLRCGNFIFKRKGSKYVIARAANEQSHSRAARDLARSNSVARAIILSSFHKRAELESLDTRLV